jgi:hypothetical protein
MIISCFRVLNILLLGFIGRGYKSQIRKCKECKERSGAKVTRDGTYGNQNQFIRPELSAHGGLFTGEIRGIITMS